MNHEQAILNTKVLKEYFNDYINFTLAYTKHTKLSYGAKVDITNEAIYKACIENKICNKNYVENLIKVYLRKEAKIAENELVDIFLNRILDTFEGKHPLSPVALNKTYGNLAVHVAGNVALRLNKRQLFILNSVRQGMSQKAIAKALGTKQINICLSLKNMCKTIYKKLNKERVATIINNIRKSCKKV
jgi:DNA-binding NarL/FixJ family response regulator